MRIAGVFSIFLTVGLASALTVNTFLTYACSRQSFISNARTVAASYREAESIFKRHGIPTAGLNIAVQVSDDLIEAFEQNQNAAALDLVATLINRTREIIVNDLAVIKDEAIRVQVMDVLALGNIALHWIANNIVKEIDKVAAGATSAPDRASARANASSSGALDTVKAFAAAEPWGKAYK